MVPHALRRQTPAGVERVRALPQSAQGYLWQGQPDRHTVPARAGWDMEADGPFMRRRSYPQVYRLTVTQASLD